MKDQVTERALKIAKERFGWNQARFAKALDVEKQHVTNWLARRMPADRYATVARVLEISVEELISGEPANSYSERAGAANISEPRLVGYGIDISREAFLFASEWEKVPEPMKSQISALVHALVSESAREKRKRPKDPPSRSSNKIM
jgi:transcriptional regulator with XRE-family HTH domain